MAKTCLPLPARCNVSVSKFYTERIGMHIGSVEVKLVHIVPGQHFSITQGPNVHVLNAAMHCGCEHT